MKDNEIIKALERCGNWQNAESCEDCPASTYGFGCAHKMAKHTLDLINCQKAEIEQWKEEANRYQNLWCEAETDAQTAKAEAIKEFAEKLKNSILPQLSCSTLETKEAYYFCLDNIDNLVKEMAGDIE